MFSMFVETCIRCNGLICFHGEYNWTAFENRSSPMSFLLVLFAWQMGILLLWWLFDSGYDFCSRKCELMQIGVHMKNWIELGSTFLKCWLLCFCYLCVFVILCVISWIDFKYLSIFGGYGQTIKNCFDTFLLLIEIGLKWAFFIL